MTTHYLCASDALPRDSARGFSLTHQGQELEIVLVDVGGAVRAYHNRCPHTGVTLNWMPDRFLDISGRYLQCSTHMALFDRTSGLCVHGPCSGQSLGTMPLDIRPEGIYLVVEDYQG